MKFIKYILLLIIITSTAHSKWELFNNENSILEGDAYSAIVDYNNTVWVRAKSQLIAIDGDKWRKYDSTDSDYINNVYDLTLDKNGNLWFVSNGNIIRFDNGEFIKVDSIKGIGLIEFDSDNNYWVASKESIFKHQDGKFIEKYRDTTTEIDFTRLIINNKNDVYFSRFFYSDLCRLNEDSTVICYDFQNSDAPQNYTMYSSALDSNGNIWVGSRFLIFNYDGNNWTILDTLKTTDDRYGRNYRGMAFDKNSSLWALANYSFTFNSYLFKIDENIESHILDSTQLGKEFFNLVEDLDVDFSGNVWVSSTMGLFKFTPDLTSIENEEPSNSNLKIKFDNEILNIVSQEKINSIKVFNLMGAEVFSIFDVNSFEHSINTNNLIKGLYILRVNDMSYKFMKH